MGFLGENRQTACLETAYRMRARSGCQPIAKGNAKGQGERPAKGLESRICEDLLGLLQIGHFCEILQQRRFCPASQTAQPEMAPVGITNDSVPKTNYHFLCYGLNLILVFFGNSS